LTENVNDTIVIYTDDCDFEVCSNHMIVNNAGDKAICSVGNNKFLEQRMIIRYSWIVALLVWLLGIRT
jgi:hypothetical protein